MTKRRVLILCTGNSCRSQMVEGLINHFLSEEWEAFSAGSAPTGTVHPLAVQVMGELGIDIRQHRSKSVEIFRNAKLDLVITVCDHAAERCPVWVGENETAHISFPDPAAATGSESEKIAVFRCVRDEIRQHVLQYLSG